MVMVALDTFGSHGPAYLLYLILSFVLSGDLRFEYEYTMEYKYVLSIYFAGQSKFSRLSLPAYLMSYPFYL